MGIATDDSTPQTIHPLIAWLQVRVATCHFAACSVGHPVVSVEGLNEIAHVSHLRVNASVVVTVTDPVTWSQVRQSISPHGSRGKAVTSCRHRTANKPTHADTGPSIWRSIRHGVPDAAEKWFSDGEMSVSDDVACRHAWCYRPVIIRCGTQLYDGACRIATVTCLQLACLSHHR